MIQRFNLFISLASYERGLSCALKDFLYFTVELASSGGFRFNLKYSLLVAWFFVKLKNVFANYHPGDVHHRKATNFLLGICNFSCNIFY